MVDIEKIKKEIVDRLKPLNPAKIILFGSYVYGNPSEDSDLDICVIDEKVDSKRDRKLKIRKALKDIKVAKDILVESQDYFLSHSDKNWINTALYDARHKGIVLYEKK